MNTKGFLALSQYRSFWRLRAFALRIRFTILNRIFKVRQFAKEERTNAGVLVAIVVLTVPQLLLAVAIALILQLVELILVPALVKWWPAPDAAAYVSWLGTIGQIGGVFIALYFTAVAAAAGAIFAQVPNNVRDLLAQERVGSIYIRYLTIATFLPICFIALHLLGMEPLRIAVPFLVLSTGSGIIAFAVLGRRAFDLFDPTRLSGHLFADLDRWLDQVSAGGFRWLDSSFQSHAHRQAASIADALLTLSEIASSQSKKDSGPLLDLTINILNSLAYYQYHKLRIPTGSLWFKQARQHKDWYLTEDSTVQLAHHLGITLDPETVAEHNWLEERLQPIVLKCFKLIVEGKRSDSWPALLGALDRYVAALAASGNVSRATALIETMIDVHEQEARLGAKGGKASEQIEDIGIAEGLSFLQLEVLVTYGNDLKDRTPDSTIERLKRVRWERTKSLYINGFFADELKQLEWALPRLQLERRVEGATVTPLWYVQALLSKCQAERLAESVGAIMGAGERLFLDWADRLKGTGRVWQSAALLSRCLEYLNKLENHHLSLFANHFASLGKSRYLSDLRWPDIKPEEWSGEARRFRDRLVQAMADHVVLLLNSKKPAAIPDYFGQFMHETGEALFNALLDQRVSDVVTLASHYFIGTLALFEKLKPAGKDFDIWVEQELQIAAAPVLDIVELSGYGKVLAELHGKEEMWAAITKAWEGFLKGDPKRLQWLSAVVAAGEPRFRLPHRGLVRTNWGIRVQAEINKLPRREIRGNGVRFLGLWSGETVEHDSALVRYCAKNPFNSGKEIFVGLYLSKQAGADKLDWGLRRGNLEAALEREEKWYNELGDGDD